MEQPCKSYTPLGALSSMQPPGSQGNHPNMSPRRHSAFSTPQHGESNATACFYALFASSIKHNRNYRKLHRSLHSSLFIIRCDLN